MKPNKTIAKTNLLLAVGLGFLLCGPGTRASAQTPMPPPPAADKPSVTQPAPPIIEAAAINLLKRNQEAMFALKTYSAECRNSLTQEGLAPGQPNGQYQFATLSAGKPNKMRYDCWLLAGSRAPDSWTKPATTSTFTFASDGITNYKQFGKSYRRDMDLSPDNMNTILEPWGGFYAISSSPYDTVRRYQQSKELSEARIVGREQVEGVLCSKVLVHTTSAYNGQKAENTTTWYIGPDSLVRRCIDRSAFNDQPGKTFDFVLTNIRVNKPVNAALYAYTPPPGVTLKQAAATLPLLANGTPAPDFSAVDRDNKAVKLSDLRGKAVVIDFWASWCLPCNAAMPHNQAVIKKLQAEGLPVVMLAVDNADTRAAFDGWIKRQSKGFSSLQFVFVPASDTVSSSYQAMTIPTQYVLDKNGVIRAGFMGYEGPTDALETAVRAALAADTAKPTADSGKPNAKKPLTADTGSKTAAFQNNR